MIERDPLGRIAALIDQAGDARVAAALLDRRLAVEHLIALGADMGGEPVELAARVVAQHEAQIDARGRDRGDDVARRRADLGASQAVDVERGLLDQLGEPGAAAFGRGRGRARPSARASGAGTAAISARSAAESGVTSS